MPVALALPVMRAGNTGVMIPTAATASAQAINRVLDNLCIEGSFGW